MSSLIDLQNAKKEANYWYIFEVISRWHKK